VKKTKLSSSRELLRQALKAELKAVGVCAGERIGVGVSGGADSVALLRLLLGVRDELGIVLCVAHFNHQLRGRSADADEAFVRKLAQRHELEFFVERESVATKARREKANLEDAARRARYTYFDRLVKEHHLNRVAVAHTADDQAETVLAHILRGTGLAGLGGIHPQSRYVFRPLLKTRRAELRSYLRSLKQPWREDKTNKDTTRTRARIRHKLLPLLEKQFSPSVVDHLCQLAELAREDNVNLERHAELRLSAVAKEKDGAIAIPIREMLLGTTLADGKSANKEDVPWPEAARAISKRMVRRLVQQVKPQAGELSAQHVDEVLRLAAHGHSGKLLQLPGGVEVRRETDTLVFRPALTTHPQTASNGYEHTIDFSTAPEPLRLDAHSRILLLWVIDWPTEGRETSGLGAILDLERLRLPLVLRNWRPGDSFRPRGHQKPHKLARLLNELGVSRWQKEFWPVLTSGGNIAWALGLPVAEEFAVREGSRRAIVISEDSAS
jgi:tRNA(Ile)-lysidine synthase